MAEVVHRQVEELLPVFEELNRVDLFTEKEVKSLIKKITAYEYKLVRQQKLKENFLQYIQYKINLLELIKKRRQKTQYYFKKDEIEYAIIGTIHKLFKICCSRWSGDLKLWMSHVKFCKTWNKKYQMSKIWSSLLKFHANKPKMWIMAAQSEIDNSDFENARGLFLRGLRHHVKDNKLWLEYFRMELIAALKTRERLNTLMGEKKTEMLEEMDEKDAAMLKGAVAKLVYKNAVVTIPNDILFSCKFIDISLEFLHFAHEVSQFIIDDITEKFSEDPLARSMLARIYLHPVFHDNEEKSEENSELYEERCFAEYENALLDINTMEMYDYYVSFTLERLEHYKGQVIEKSDRSNNSSKLMKLYNKLFEICDKAFKTKKLSESSCLKYVNTLLNLGNLENVEKILMKIESEFSTPKIQFKILEYNLMLFNYEKKHKTSCEKIESLFDDLAENSVELNDADQDKFWNLWLNYGIVLENEDGLLHVLKTAIKTQSEFVTKIKIAILRWFFTYRSFGESRNLFSEVILQLGKVTKELYLEIIHLLETSGQKKSNAIKEYYEEALNRFKNDVELWLKYNMFIKRHFPSKVGETYWKATKSIKDENLQQFLEEYSLLDM